jgi:SagB-type dehydrogenase family enzyme
MFRTDHPVAWAYHRNTSRWLHNSIDGPSPVDSAPRPPKEHPDAPFTPLPQAAPTPLTVLLGQRVSCRAFASTAIALADLAAVLHAGYGVHGQARLGALEFLERPVPSGGGLYPLELYVIARAVDPLPAGVYHYTPVTAGLEQLREVSLPARFLTYLFMGQPLAARAGALIVITAVVSRSLTKYADRGYRYQLLEAGHVGQNLSLGAVEHGLGVCSLGGFFDDELAALLCVDTDLEIALYALAVGVPASPDREQQRALDQD